MKILITGAAGFIGSHMAQSLASAGHAVIGIDNFSEYYDRALKEMNREAIVASGVRFIEADLLDNLNKVLPSDIEVVYHFAAQPGISSKSHFLLYEQNNIVATQNLLEWSMSLGTTLKMFVNISTSSVYGLEAISNEEVTAKPVSDYGVTKLAAEQFVLEANRLHKMPACSMRLYSVYGPRERPEKLYTKLIKAITEETPFPLFKGSEKHLRSFTYVGDIVQGLSAILAHLDACNGEIINLGNDQVYSTAEGIAIIEQILEKKVIINSVESRLGDQLKTAADITKAARILKYTPQTSLKEGLEQQVRWYQNNFC